MKQPFFSQWKTKLWLWRYQRGLRQDADAAYKVFSMSPSALNSAAWQTAREREEEWESLRLTASAHYFGIDIPESRMSKGPLSGGNVVAQDSLPWARREIRKARVAEWKHWAAIWSAIISPIIAVLSLWVALSRR